MTDQEPTNPPPPVPPGYILLPAGSLPPQRPRPEMNTKDLLALIFAFTPLSIVALALDLSSRSDNRRAGTRQHPFGIAGWMFGAIGCAIWSVLALPFVLGALYTESRGSSPQGLLVGAVLLVILGVLFYLDRKRRWEQRRNREPVRAAPEDLAMYSNRR